MILRRFPRGMRPAATGSSRSRRARRTAVSGSASSASAISGNRGATSRWSVTARTYRPVPPTRTADAPRRSTSSRASQTSSVKRVDRELLARIGHVDQVVGHCGPFRRRRLGGADVHPPIDLHRIAADDLDRTSIPDAAGRQLHGERRLSRSRTAHDDQMPARRSSIRRRPGRRILHAPPHRRPAERPAPTSRGAGRRRSPGAVRSRLRDRSRREPSDGRGRCCRCRRGAARPPGRCRWRCWSPPPPGPGRGPRPRHPTSRRSRGPARGDSGGSPGSRRRWSRRGRSVRPGPARREGWRRSRSGLMWRYDGSRSPLLDPGAADELLRPDDHVVRRHCDVRSARFR